MSDKLLTFFVSLFGIKRSRMLKIEMLEGDVYGPIRQVLV